jgi:hypothetical protein
VEVLLSAGEGAGAGGSAVVLGTGSVKLPPVSDTGVGAAASPVGLTAGLGAGDAGAVTGSLGCGVMAGGAGAVLSTGGAAG